MEIIKGKEQIYKDWYNKNKDPYGRACFSYAERWAEMMEKAIDESEYDTVAAIALNAERLSHEANTEGITGYMYQCAISILSSCWIYGKELEKWNNGEYRHVELAIKEANKRKKANKIELKTCPFCGGRAEVIKACNDKFVARCALEFDYCLVRPNTVLLDTENEAAEAWNERPLGQGEH